MSSYYDRIDEENVGNELLDEENVGNGWLDEENVGNESLGEDRIYDFISKPIKSEICTIDENILQIQLFNICAADDHTVVYAAGNYVNVFDTDDGSLRFRKCVGNGGIGHITKNPVSSHIAVGENGDDPLIVVYEWPSFDIVRVLRGGTTRRYNWLNFSQTGELLCSQGGEPDNMLTIWDWEKSKIILSTKSHTQDVYVCRFSEFIPGHLVTAGAGHIKFWKMESTFTGLKLLGQLGRFGKTNISDVVGTFSMDDEKIISGCQWGNILVWDEGLIDVELTLKNRIPCHSAPIIMFLYSEHANELISVSMDGTIKIWFYQVVLEANPPEEDKVVEIDPSFTISVADAAGIAKIMGMCKINNDPNSEKYFVQDGNGGIWLVDIEVAVDTKQPRRLAKFHGDSITSLQSSPIGYFVATTSLDGWLHVYDVVGKKLIFAHDFKAPITSSVWLRLKTAGPGSIFAIGFQSGVLKTVAVPLEQMTAGQGPPKLFEIQNSKPHTGNISCLAVNRGVKVLVCGSDDCTIFVYKIETEPVALKPIGMYPMPGKVNHIHWKPSEKRRALISCASGHIVEVTVPANRPVYTKDSFRLALESRVIQTVGLKSELLRLRHEAELLKKQQERLDRDDGAADDDPREEVDEEEPLPESSGPAAPNAVLFAAYTPSGNTVWASVDGEDAGFLTEYTFDAPRPVKVTAIPRKGDTPLTAMTAFGTGQIKMIMGFADGRVRITNISVDNIHDLNDYIEYPIHDNRTGRVKALCWSQDNHMLYTYGDDGNIFSFTFQCDVGVIEKGMVPVSKLPTPTKPIETNIIKTKENLRFSLEELKINKEKRRVSDIASKRKKMIICSLFKEKEKLKKVVADSKSLLEPLLFPRDYFQFDERFTSLRVKEARSKAKMLPLKFELEKSLLGRQKVNYFVVRGITPLLKIKGVLKDTSVETFLNHESHQSIFLILMEELISKKRPKHQEQTLTLIKRSDVPIVQKLSEIESFLLNVHHMYSSLPWEIRFAIDKFTKRINFEKNITKTIENIRKSNQDSVVQGNELKNDDKTLFNPKSAKTVNPSVEPTISMEDKLKEYMHVVNQIESSKSVFNQMVADLKERKKKIKLDSTQLKSDMSVEYNESEDEEITTPSHFPDILLDETNSSHLTDHFKPIGRVESTHLTPSNQERRSKEVLGGSITQAPEKLTPMETTIRRLMNKEKLKYRNTCLQNAMLLNTIEIDRQISAKKAMRKGQLYAIEFVELFALTLKEELMVLSVFDLIQDEYEYRVYVQFQDHTNLTDEIESIRMDIEQNGQFLEDKGDELIDIQQTFDSQVRNEKYAKYLRKIFKKKYKPPKVKVDQDNEESSSSSSSESSESEPEKKPNTNQTTELLPTENIFFVFNETTRPDDCDEHVFDLTIKLRSRRHHVEQSMQEIKDTIEMCNKKLRTTISELNVTEKKLKQTTVELETYQNKKKSKLNDVETTVKLNKHSISTTASLAEALLIYVSAIPDIEERLIAYTKEIGVLIEMIKKEIVVTAKDREKRKKIKQALNNQNEILKSEVTKKFKTETDWNFLNDMEMSIINFMIFHHKFSLNKNQRAIIDLKKAIKEREQQHLNLLIHGACKLKKEIEHLEMYKGLMIVDNDLSNVDDNVVDVNQPMELYIKLLQQKKDLEDKITVLLQRDIVSDQLLPGSEIIVGSDDVALSTAYPEDVFGEMAPTAEHHLSEGIVEEVFDVTTPENEYHYAEGLEEEVFGDTALTAEQHFAEDGYDVFDAMPQTIEHYFAEDMGEDVVDQTQRSAEHYFSEEDLADETRDDLSVGDESARGDGLP